MLSTTEQCHIAAEKQSGDFKVRACCKTPGHGVVVLHVPAFGLHGHPLSIAGNATKRWLTCTHACWVWLMLTRQTIKVVDTSEDKILKDPCAAQRKHKEEDIHGYTCTQQKDPYMTSRTKLR